MERRAEIPTIIPATLAQRLIADHARPLGDENVDLSRAAGRVLAEAVAAPEDLPAFDHSAMDGYAARSADLRAASPAGPVSLALRGRRAAGEGEPLEVGPGETARIFTGAAIPTGADCVVMQERATATEGRVSFPAAAPSGQHVRARGEDVRAGQVVLRPGSVLRPYEIGLLAALGIGRVQVSRRPRVGVLATGDELLASGPGRIRNSNGPALCAALARWGIPAADLGAAADRPEELRAALRRAGPTIDVLLVTGGVSVGDLDLTRAALAGEGFEEVFWRVAIKPGKPLAFFSAGRRLAFGLPGNPVAALLCLEEFVRPALEGLEGLELRFPSYHLRGRTLNAYPEAAGRRQYLFCEAKSAGDAFELGIIRPQGSAMLGMACRANALALAEPGPVGKGDSVPFRWLK